MQDVRERDLAKKIVEHSIAVKKEEKVAILYSGECSSFLQCLVHEIFSAGGYPFILSDDKRILKILIDRGNAFLFEKMAEYHQHIVDDMDAVILVSASDNVYEMKGVSNKKLQEYQRIYVGKVHIESRLKKKWVLLKLPTASFAQSASLPTEQFENYLFTVCTMDYSKLRNCMEPLARLMSKTDKVRIVAPDTDLSFSIKGINSVKCAGECNIPDGELYTAPVKSSVNGHIRFNIPVMHDGDRFDSISLSFQDGKIVRAECGANTDKLIDILDTDSGSRFVGEFAFGLNPFVLLPVNDILFDEKMYGSIHMAVGNAYDDASNGNRSALHWDLILNQRPEYGGGEIFFDGRLIRKDGEFILPELLVLNRDNLI